MSTVWSAGDGKPLRDAPHARRNRDPILAVLARVLPAAGTVLEIGSGTGQHLAWFAPRLPGLDWQSSDTDAEMRGSIAAWAADCAAANLRAPLDIDVSAADWERNPGLEDIVAILSCNLIHIAPWRACEGLLAGAGRLLAPGGVLVLYGPFKRGGVHTAPSNAAFDASLRGRDPAWGIRDLEAVARLAESHGLALDEVIEMPANNLSLIFRRD